MSCVCATCRASSPADFLVPRMGLSAHSALPPIITGRCVCPRKQSSHSSHRLRRRWQWQWWDVCSRSPADSRQTNGTMFAVWPRGCLHLRQCSSAPVVGRPGQEFAFMTPSQLSARRCEPLTAATGHGRVDWVREYRRGRLAQYFTARASVAVHLPGFL